MQGVMLDQTDDLGAIAGWIRRARCVTVLTGAGISTESGIPDFRGPDGLWTKDPKAERMSDLASYMSDGDLRCQAWAARRVHPAWTAAPNPGHDALADLEKKGKLHMLITQNIDGLHLAAGSSPDRTVEIHGSIREVMCMACDARSPMSTALERVAAGDADPHCERCGGILKSATISFGQSLVQEDVERAWRAAAASDLFLAVGTSLAVLPVAQLPQVALDHGARLVIFNAQETPYDAHAHGLVRAPLGKSLPKLAALV
jgi:NAD-dependent protein deacetylase/lipoamidase